MQRINLVVLNLSWVKTKRKSTYELWNVWREDYQEFLKRGKFDNKINLYLGCFEISVFDAYLNVDYKDFIDKVVFKYNDCQLTIELYKNDKLIEKYEVDYYKYIRKNNINIFISKF